MDIQRRPHKGAMLEALYRGPLCCYRGATALIIDATPRGSAANDDKVEIMGAAPVTSWAMSLGCLAPTLSALVVTLVRAETSPTSLALGGWVFMESFMTRDIHQLHQGRGRVCPRVWMGRECPQGPSTPRRTTPPCTILRLPRSWRSWCFFPGIWKSWSPTS